MAGNEDLFAYAGLTLRINLSSGEIRKEPTRNYAREWVGSTGIAIKILYDELKSWVTPYDPANKIVFGTGVLQGTPAPGACKMSVSTLGPRTGGWASGCCDSYVGGELKCAGYDTIVVEGRASKPVFLWIHDETVEIRSARTKLEGELDPKRFVRVHKSHLVNIARGVEVTPWVSGDWRIRLQGGAEVNLSRRYRQRFEALAPVRA
jgi:hypothetical protein